MGGVAQGSDGKLYGTTFAGGGLSNGTIFRVDTTGDNFQDLYDFGNPEGFNRTGLIAASDGYLYGSSLSGGTAYKGSVYRMSTTGQYTTVASVNAPLPDGAQPQYGAVQSADGTLYGTTQMGGPYSKGTVYKIAPNGTLTTIYTFAGTNGYWPSCLALASDGNLYGIADGGANGAIGEVFRITLNGVMTPLHYFTGPDGYYPTGLAMGADGVLYGVTPTGGQDGKGTIFKITTAGVFTTLFHFNNTNGASPAGNPYLASDGNLYGVTQSGGDASHGTVYQLSSTGTLTTLHSFVGTDGDMPDAGVTEGPDGSLYGTTYLGGGYNVAGVIYKIAKDGTGFTVLHRMNYLQDGGDSVSSLLLAPDGYFYGSGYAGGAGQYGTLFRISPSGAFERLYQFQHNIDGQEPNGGLILAKDGNIIGTCLAGGTHGGGSVFKLAVVLPTTPAGLTLQSGSDHLQLDWTAATGRLRTTSTGPRRPAARGLFRLRLGLRLLPLPTAT